MSRSDIYKSIIIVLGIIFFISGIIYYYASDDLFVFLLDEEYAKGLRASIMVTIWASGFVFCMFLYLLADILDRLEIVSAQTIRTTRVLEDFEDKKEEKM